MAIEPAAISSQRHVPAQITRPPYVGLAAPEPYLGPDVQTRETIEKMRVAGRIAARAMHAGAAAIAPGVTTDQLIAPGVTTDQLNGVVHEFIIGSGAYPSTLGYRGFPKSC